VRNARGGDRPDVVRIALAAIAAGADGITAHLREDRRHIRDTDMARLKAEIAKPLNFEMAATAEMNSETRMPASFSRAMNGTSALC
jgi:pyridoxine 5-phosphate synthase